MEEELEAAIDSVVVPWLEEESETRDSDPKVGRPEDMVTTATGEGVAVDGVRSSPESPPHS